ncbi:hypothetical protein M3Y99_00113900 [Aphelenchoides fujianensis]|nr:hypothetical protein M3Y99_00113900 [Aphelenchoides fujianensis]
MNPLQLLSAVFLVVLIAVPDCSFGSEVDESGSPPGAHWADIPDNRANYEPSHFSEEHGHKLHPHWHPRPLFRPCKELFKLVKERVKDVAHLEKPQLQGMIDDACKQLHEHLLERVCRKIGAKELDRLFDLILNKDKLIDPEHACTALHACK